MMQNKEGANMNNNILFELYDYCETKFGKEEIARLLHSLEAEFPYHIEGIDRHNFIRNFMDWLVLEKVFPETGKRITELYIEDHQELSQEMKQNILNTKNIIVSKFVVISKEGLNITLKDMNNGRYYTVTQIINNPQIRANTIIEGRIFPYGNIYRLAGVMVLMHTPMIVDPDILMHAYEKREIERIESMLLAPSTTLTAVLNKYPFQWVDGMCEALSLETRGKKNEKVREIANKVVTDLPSIIHKIPEKSREALTLVLKNDGYVKYNALKEYADEMPWWWNNTPPTSTIGILRLYGLIIIGKMPHGTKLYKTAIIPNDIKEELQKLSFIGTQHGEE